MIVPGAALRAAGNVPHSVELMSGQLLLIALANLPEVREGLVGPELLTIRFLGKLGDSYTVLIRRHLFRHNIHCYFAKIHIGADSRCCCHAGLMEYITNHF